MPLAIFVTGGAGYIGSHMVKLLLRDGFTVTVFDNLSTGHRDAVSHTKLILGDLCNQKDISKALATLKHSLVMHFAASCYVGDSMSDPAKYYANNVVGTLNLLNVMREANVSKLVFSSSCSTYGNPLTSSISETHPQSPVSPYGMSKLCAERAIADYARAYDMQAIALRYFNAAGCDPEGELGERHEPETHLIPLVLREALRVRNGGDPQHTSLEVYGTEFETSDGTCIRDYVHVSDLCNAHLLALRRLLRTDGRSFEAFNLGTEQGHSVSEVVSTCRHVTGQDIRFRIVARRPGDPARLVASAELARRVLSWRPEYTTLAQITRTAWDWMVSQSACVR